VKFELARELVARFHDAAAAEHDQREFISRVSEKAIPTDLVPKAIQVEAAGMRIGNVLKEAGLAASSSEANRKVDEKAVKVDGTRVTDRGLTFHAGADHVFQVGSHRFARVKFEPKA
jgi:tyrosyl-tRNA synthetase